MAKLLSIQGTQTISRKFRLLRKKLPIGGIPGWDRTHLRLCCPIH